ncbi:MAG: glycosyltransferase family 2 protein, partial [Limisphaerales bacterium]
MSDSSHIVINSNADIPPCLAVVMPVYNEEKTVASILELVLAQRPVQEVIVVDDASTDKTYEVLKNIAEKHNRIKLFRHDYNQGKGAALRTGFSKVSAPYVIIQDADLEYDPREYLNLL